MKFVHVVKGKLLVAVFAGALLVGGATGAFAATPAGQRLVQSVMHGQSGAMTPGVVSHKNHGQGTPGSGGSPCPGLPDAQRLASTFSLNSDSTGDSVQVICALHQGTFQGTTPGGTSIASSRVYGYGEIEMLLTYAQYLAAHNTANTGGKLTSSNARSYLAQALHGCATTPIETCLITNIPGFQPGSDHGSGNPTANQSNHGRGNGNPTSTPTPHH